MVLRPPVAGRALAVWQSILVVLLGWTACSLDRSGLAGGGVDAAAAAGGRGGGVPALSGGAPGVGGGAGASGRTGAGGDGAVGAGGAPSSGGASGAAGGWAVDAGADAVADAMSDSGGDAGASGAGGGSPGGNGGGIGGRGGASGVGGRGGRGGNSGNGGNAGNGGSTGGGGAPGSGGVGPWCPALTTARNETPAKGVACGVSDPHLCYRPCGPSDGTAEVGYKAETCALGQYDEGDCQFPGGVDYSCFSLPASISRSCPNTTPRDSTPCSVAACMLCNNNGLYMDSSGVTKMGYCVCPPANSPGAGTWSCASTTAWPCPGAQGC